MSRRPRIPWAWAQVGLPNGHRRAAVEAGVLLRTACADKERTVLVRCGGQFCRQSIWQIETVYRDNCNRLLRHSLAFNTCGETF